MKFPLCQVVCALMAALPGLGIAQTSPLAPDIPAVYQAPAAQADHVRRDVMIPMRDGVKLHTVIIVPRGSGSAPILLTRTPYNASKRVERNPSRSMLGSLPEGDDVFAAGGYIRVFQDVRGKHGSEGDFIMTRPPRGPLNASGIDETTDAWDTIDWLVGHVPESNGRVGMIGSSYEGFTVVMALLEPHPALKVAVPESPMVDGWMGDDWFHYGAFRQSNFDYFTFQTSRKTEGKPIAREGYDDYDNFLRAGSAGDFAKAAGLDQLPWWRKVSEHPAYDAFWRDQALDRLIALKPPAVPTMWEQGLWDQEDMWGAVHCYAALEGRDRENDRNFLVLGPWRHSQVNYDGSSLGPLNWTGDTSLQFRRDVLKPFLDQYLRPGAPRADTPPVLVYNTGENRWERFKSWPVNGGGWVAAPRPLYLAAGFRLSFAPPADGPPGFDEYLSDPAKPVPFVPRPIRFGDRDLWTRWLVTDQRGYSDRPDVLAYATEPLTEPLRVSGGPSPTWSPRRAARTAIGS